MIRKITNFDFEKIIELGKKYDNEFTKHYDLNLYLNDDVNNILIYDDCKGFIIYKNLIDEIDIELVYVDEEFRNKKIATSLINELFKLKKKIELEVSLDNQKAKTLYEKLGFKEVLVRKGYYNGIDAVVMIKENE